MTPEEQQNDMSMEDILSSIKDILEGNSQEENPLQENTPTETPSTVAVSPEEKSEEEKPEEDVFDLSTSMIVEEALPDSSPKVEFDEAGPDFDIKPNQEDVLLSPDDVQLPDFDDKDINIGLTEDMPQSYENDTILDEKNAQEPENIMPDSDDFSFNIDDILQSASQAIEEDKVTEVADIKMPEEDSLPDFSQFNDEIDITSEPILEEENDSVSIMNTGNNIVEEEADTSKEDILADFEEESIPEPIENIAEPIENIPEPIENIAEPIENIPEAIENIAEPIENIPEPAEKILEISPVPEPEIAPAIDINPAEASIEATSPVSDFEEHAEKQDIEINQTDATDVSADIINNFAKMFAEKAQEQPQEQAENKKDELPVEVTSLGNGNKTIEQVVEGVIQGIVASSVNAEMTKNVDIVSYAQKEIREQTQAWLEANLPAIVEAAVQKEIERVMAKVGK